MRQALCCNHADFPIQSFISQKIATLVAICYTLDRYKEVASRYASEGKGRNKTSSPNGFHLVQRATRMRGFMLSAPGGNLVNKQGLK